MRSQVTQVLAPGAFVPLGWRIYLSIVAIDTSVPMVAEALLQNESRVLVQAVNRVPKGDLFHGGKRAFFWWAPWFGNGGAEVRQRARH